MTAVSRLIVMLVFSSCRNLDS